MNPTTIILAAVALLAILASKKKGPGAPPQAPGATNAGGPVVQPTTEEIAAAMAALVPTYGRDIARNVERIYRLETANFTSGLFGLTNMAGMKALTPAWPFGWGKRGTNAGMFAPVVTMRENSGQGPFDWVAFRRFDDAAQYLAKFLRDYNNDPARWRTTDLAGATAANYRAAITNINPQFT